MLRSHNCSRLWRPIAMVAIATCPALAQSGGASAAPDTLRLSLGGAGSIALRPSDEIGIAAAQTEIADASYGVARARVLPQLRLNTSYTPADGRRRGPALGSVFNPPNTYAA